MNDEQWNPDDTSLACSASNGTGSGRMNDKQRKATDGFERATRQLDIMEQLITLLMDGIDFGELKMSDRLNIALKLMAEHARTLKLREDISEEDNPTKQEAFLENLNENLKRQMRGDSSKQDFDKPFASQDKRVSPRKGIDLFDLDMDANPFLDLEDEF